MEEPPSRDLLFHSDWKPVWPHCGVFLKQSETCLQSIREHLSGYGEVSWWPSGKKKQIGRGSTISPSADSLELAASSSDYCPAKK